MKAAVLSLNCLILLSLLACNTSTETINKTIGIENKGCKPYFDFDKIEHYYLNISEDKVYNPDSINDKTEKEKRKLDLLTNLASPQKLADTSEFANLESFDFTKAEVPSAKFDLINGLFCEKTHENAQYSACAPVYRDILIFRKDAKIVGMAKICFTCDQHVIVGTTRNTEEFGQSGDYDKLKNILHH
ncbi:MAG: hypothetical protein K0Q95_2870 [Bacteroidota bacterium]|jgi:hypothetical protein|nr:hypothetical protein [Bacteroidota bacterium]